MCVGSWFELAAQLRRVGYLRWLNGLAWALEKGASGWDVGRRWVFGCLRVLDRKVKRWRHPYVGIRFAMSYRRFVGVFIVDGGCLELCLWWVFRDLVGLGFWWVHLYSAGFRGLRSFYMSFSVFSSPGGDLLRRSWAPKSPGLLRRLFDCCFHELLG